MSIQELWEWVEELKERELGDMQYLQLGVRGRVQMGLLSTAGDRGREKQRRRQREEREEALEDVAGDQERLRDRTSARAGMLYVVGVCVKESRSIFHSKQQASRNDTTSDLQAMVVRG